MKEEDVGESLIEMMTDLEGMIKSAIESVIVLIEIMTDLEGMIKSAIESAIASVEDKDKRAFIN